MKNKEGNSHQTFCIVKRGDCTDDVRKALLRRNWVETKKKDSFFCYFIMKLVSISS
jgi:hypothetical protein